MNIRRSVASALKLSKAFVQKNDTTIMAVAGVACFVKAIHGAIVATPKAVAALEALNENPDFKQLKEEVPMRAKAEEIVTAGKYYIFPAIECAVGTFCVLKGNNISVKRNIAAIGTCNALEKLYDEYRSSVIEEIGEKKERKVMNRVAQKEIDRSPVANTEINFTEGDTYFLEPISGRYFKSTLAKVEGAIVDLNRDYLGEGEQSLNDLNYLLGLASTEGGQVIWKDIPEILISTSGTGIMPDGRACNVLYYITRPKESHMY